MSASEEALNSASARQWRRWLWQTVQTYAPRAGLAFDDAVFQENGLAGLIGGQAYGDLVEKLAGRPDMREISSIAQGMLDQLFPYKCRCRRPSAMDRDYLNFSGSHVFRSLYFSDPSVTDHMELLFRRTPGIELFECRECGDGWLRALDQVTWDQHLVLLEPEDIDRISADGIWPTALDSYEDAWVSEFGIVGRNSANLHAWQAAHNTPAACRRFGK